VHFSPITKTNGAPAQQIVRKYTNSRFLSSFRTSLNQYLCIYVQMYDEMALPSSKLCIFAQLLYHLRKYPAFQDQYSKHQHSRTSTQNTSTPEPALKTPALQNQYSKHLRSSSSTNTLAPALQRQRSSSSTTLQHQHHHPPQFAPARSRYIGTNCGKLICFRNQNSLKKRPKHLSA
jgi:hypothetical protein